MLDLAMRLIFQPKCLKYGDQKFSDAPKGDSLLSFCFQANYHWAIKGGLGELRPKSVEMGLKYFFHNDF